MKTAEDWHHEFWVRPPSDQTVNEVNAQQIKDIRAIQADALRQSAHVLEVRARRFHKKATEASMCNARALLNAAAFIRRKAAAIERGEEGK